MKQKIKKTVTFLHECPSCQAEYKIIKKCRCGTYVCSACAYDNVCFECYILLNKQKERNIYFKEKREGLITPQI